MDYNLAGLRQRVLVDKLDDDEFDAGVVDRFINDTQRDIFNQFELPFQEKIFQGTIPAGSTMFQLPSDVAQIQSQSFAGMQGFNNQKVAWRKFFEYFPDVANSTPGAPSYWSLYARNILLNAPTDKEYKMTLFYIRKPAKLVGNTDVPELPEEFEELLVLGAFRRVLERNEDFDLAASINEQYQAQLLLLVNRYGFREADGGVKMQNSQI